ncbi:MAG: hypothetical protein FWC76_06585 [Defluviitaleaceae bacterium]|nr:hypothetical protein [Defluviitaleaceae bacterium]
MKQSKSYRKILSEPKEREKLIKQISGNFFRRKLGFGWADFICSLILGLSPMIAITLLFNMPGGPIFTAIIIAATLAAIWFLPVSFMRRRLKFRAVQQKMWRNLEMRHGGLFKILAEIKRLLEDEDMPLYTVKEHDSIFHIVGKWFICINHRHIAHISEIAEGHENKQYVDIVAEYKNRKVDSP